MLQGKQPIAPHPEDVRVNARLASYPNETVERQTIQEVDQAVWARTRDYEQYLIAASRKAREDAQVDTTAAQETIDALQSEIRWGLDRPIGEVQNNIGDLAARYKQLQGVAAQVIAALERADRTEAFWAEKLADPSAALSALWEKFPMIRPLV
jgi:hypothetical protein